MDLASVHTLYDVLAADRLDLVYSGRFLDEHTPDLISIGEDTTVHGGHERSHRQRLSFVMVEAYQNIVRHRAQLEGAMGRGVGRCMFMVRARTTGDEVVAIDPIIEGETGSLHEVLDRIGGSDLKQLKELFLDRLRDGSRTMRGGAGLGLIEMARRSGNGMRHHLLPLDAAHRLFVLQVVVGGAIGTATPLDELMRMHALVGAMDLLLLCRCGRSSPTLEAVMHILEKDLDETSVDPLHIKRAFLAATEWLHSGDLIDRSFVAVAREADGYALVAGGIAPPDMIDRRKEEVTRINALSPSDRDRYYRNNLLGRPAVAGMSTGLLDLARSSEDPLRVETFPVPEGMRILVEAKLY